LAKRKPPKPRRPRKKAAPRPVFVPSKLRDQVDTYTDAIYAVLALLNHVRWDDATKKTKTDVNFGIGRRFTTSAKNSFSPNVQITPDIAIQMAPNLGLLAEAKPGVAKSKEFWEANLRQLTKYDDDLDGWWTASGRVESHDVVALIPLSRVTGFVDLVEEKIAKKECQFSRPFAIVSFMKTTSGGKTWFVLQGQQGALGRITDAVLKERLRQNIFIPMQALLTEYKDLKFIDTEPPLAYVLYVIWELLFSNMAAAKRQGESTQVDLDTTVDEVTTKLQEAYGFKSDGPRAVEVPRRAWVRRAMDALVAFGLASRKMSTDRKTELYTVHYRRYRMQDGAVIFFGRLENKNSEKLARLYDRKPLLEIAEGAQPNPSPDRESGKAIQAESTTPSEAAEAPES